MNLYDDRMLLLSLVTTFFRKELGFGKAKDIFLVSPYFLVAPIGRSAIIGMKFVRLDSLISFSQMKDSREGFGSLKSAT